MTIPATRALPAVLRALTSTDRGAYFDVGTYGPPSADPTYANVIFGTTTVKVPKLAGVAHGSEGQPAYILADASGRMLVIGTVSN